MLHIVGGTYFEYCAEPDRKDLFGSGLRAAAAVVKHSRVTLHTYASKRAEADVIANANTFGVNVNVHRTTESILFDYQHPLATPSIYPPVGFIRQSDPINISGDAILLFGMLEGCAKISAKRVVYDPQSPFKPQPFNTADSVADELALVLNTREAELLASNSKPKLDETVAKLFRDSKASAIVIKRGTHGANVYTKNKKTYVPAYRTDRVWKIGSGDVFAGVFAHFWSVERTSPHEAAMKASIAAATYCNSHMLPLPPGFEQAGHRQFLPLKLQRKSKAKGAQVYLAGPFFTMAQRWLICEARRALLHQGVRVFSPLHDVGHGDAADVADKDLKALRDSDSVLAIVDGIDSGTLFEVGYATARGISGVAFVQNEHSENLKMLEGSGCKICDDFTTAIYHTVWSAVCK